MVLCIHVQINRKESQTTLWHCQRFFNIYASSSQSKCLQSKRTEFVPFFATKAELIRSPLIANWSDPKTVKGNVSFSPMSHWTPPEQNTIKHTVLISLQIPAVVTEQFKGFSPRSRPKGFKGQLNAQQLLVPGLICRLCGTLYPVRGCYPQAPGANIHQWGLAYLQGVSTSYLLLTCFLSKSYKVPPYVWSLVAVASKLTLQGRIRILRTSASK